MLLQSLTLAVLASTCLALSLPQVVRVEGTSPAIQLVATEPPTAPAWACDVRAWVRAPDLSPNLLSSADARLVVNGSDCVDLVRWEVGLRFKERSIVRVPAEGVEVPVQPERNYTAMHGWFGGRNGAQGIWDVGRSSHSRPDVSSPYFAEMEKYEAAMKNHSLWQVEGRERIVFDSKIELGSAVGDASLPLAAVKSFAIAVPNINLPPSPKSPNHWSIGQETPEFASIETQMSYYFALTLRNGTTVELPAGTTIFNPVASLSELGESSVTGHLSVLVKPPTERRWAMRPSACPFDNTTHFHVQIDLPTAEASFRPGAQVFLNTTITRIGNDSIAPTYISFLPGTQVEQTWAVSFGRTLQQQIALRRPERGNSWDNHGALKMMTTDLVKSRKEEEEEADASDADSGFFSSSGRFGGRAVGGTELRNASVQSVLVNLTIAADIMPSFAATFKSYISYLKVEVHAVQPCLEDVVVDPNPIAEDDDLNNDDLWSTATLAERSQRLNVPRALRDEAVLRGNATIHIHVPSTKDPSIPYAPTHYLTPNTPAPMLLTALPADGSTPTFDTMMGNELRKETTGDELKRARYDVWSMKRVHRWGERADGGYQHAGQVWARKMRRGQDAMEARVLQEGFQIQA